MSDTLTHSVELSKPTDGGDGDTWAPLNNGMHDAWDRLTSGQSPISVTSADVTLTDSQAQTHKLLVYGTPAADRTITFPARSRLYHVYNNSGRTLICTVTGSAISIQIPPDTWQLVATVVSHPTIGNDLITAIGGPNAAGGHAGLIKHPGRSFFGPGMFFYDRIMGFCRRAAGVMGIALDVGTPDDSLRFDYRGSAANPTIGFPSNFLDGFYPNSGVGVGWSRSGVHRGTFGQGLLVGSPGGGDPGTGNVNVSGSFKRNGTDLPFQRIFTKLGIVPTPGGGLSLAHGLGGLPNAVLVRLCNIIPEGGYTIGSYIMNPGDVQVVADTSNVTIKFAIGGCNVLNLTTASFFVINPSNWLLDYVAYR